MSLILDGTNGVSDIDGSASTPAIRGTDANTGIFFGTDVIGFSEGGVQSGEFNASGNLKLTGNLSVGGATPATSGSGITFPATASASSDANTLDDYEEGTWTPAFFTEGDSTPITFTSPNTLYIKIGRFVSIFCNTQRNQVSVTSGVLVVTGLPFTPAANPSNIVSNLAWFDNGGVTTDYFAAAYIDAGSARIYFSQLTNPAQQQASRYIQAQNLNNSRSIYFSASYMTA